MNNTGKLLTVNEAAEYLNCHPQSIYRNNELPCIVIPGIGKRFRLDDLDGYIKHKTRGKIPDNSLYNQLFSLTSAPGFDKIISSKLGGICEMAKAKTKARYNFGYGAIYQRKTKKGKIRWYLDYRDATGVRQQKVVDHATSRDEAAEALRKRIQEEYDRKNGIVRKKISITFNEFSKVYLEDYIKVTRKNWKSDYYRLKKLDSFFINKQLKGITPMSIEKFRSGRLNAGNSKSTTNRYLALLKKMFNLAIQEGCLEKNPVQKVKFFSEEETSKERIISIEEEKRLLSESCDHLRLAIIVALNTGMRKTEILNLKWKNVDLSSKTIKVEKTKSGKIRFIPINEFLLSKLEREHGEKCKRTNVIRLISIRTAFENARERSDLEGLRFHDFRHTFATRLVRKGVDVETIRSILGHSTISVTQRYMHSNSAQKKAAVDLLNEETANKVDKKENLLHNSYTERNNPEKDAVSSLFSVN